MPNVRSDTDPMIAAGRRPRLIRLVMDRSRWRAFLQFQAAARRPFREPSKWREGRRRAQRRGCAGTKDRSVKLVQGVRWPRNPGSLMQLIYRAQKRVCKLLRPRTGGVKGMLLQRWHYAKRCIVPWMRKQLLRRPLVEHHRAYVVASSKLFRGPLTFHSDCHAFGLIAMNLPS